jgi:hypothetical protein
MASLTPGLLVFGNVQLGQTSAAQVATLTNTSTVPVSIASISFGTALAQYSQTNNCGTSLAVGASCSITIVLKPTLLAGPRNTLLKVVDGAGTQTVTLTGNGTAPSGTLTPTSLAFSPPSTKSGTVSAPKVVTLSNTGYGPLNSTVSFIGAASTQFKLVTPSPATACGTTLAAGANCTFNVVFAPTSTGSKSATMVVNDGLGFLGLPQIVSLSGTGN